MDCEWVIQMDQFFMGSNGWLKIWEELYISINFYFWSRLIRTPKGERTDIHSHFRFNALVQIRLHDKFRCKSKLSLKPCNLKPSDDDNDEIMKRKHNSSVSFRQTCYSQRQVSLNQWFPKLQKSCNTSTYSALEIENHCITAKELHDTINTDYVSSLYFPIWKWWMGCVCGTITEMSREVEAGLGANAKGFNEKHVWR